MKANEGRESRSTEKFPLVLQAAILNARQTREQCPGGAFVMTKASAKPKSSSALD